MGVQYANLTAEFIDGALYFYDSAHTTVLIVSSTGFDLRGGSNTISGASLVGTPTISTPNISTATITGTTIISTATITNTTISTASLTGPVTVSTSIAMAGATISGANLIGTTVISSATLVSSVTMSTNAYLDNPTISDAILTGNVTLSTGNLLGGITVSSGVYLAGQSISTTAVNKTLVVANIGKINYTTTDGIVYTLPDGNGSTTLVGARYIIQNRAEDAAALVVLKSFDTTAQYFFGAGLASGAGAFLLANTKVTAKKGDFVAVRSTFSTSWYIEEMVGTWANAT